MSLSGQREFHGKGYAVFATSMDTIRSSVSFPYSWEFVFFVALATTSLEQVMDLVGGIRELLVWAQRIPFGYEVAHWSSR